MDEKKFSIIVPIYNVELYLEECLNSILTQDFGNYEVILVDDGSTDSCPDICDRYVTHDYRFKTIHKTNGGVSSARNIGIKESQGKYIVFLDSDDILFPGMLKALNTCIDNESCPPDMIIGNIVHWDGEHEEIIVNNKYYIQEQKRTLLELNEEYAAKGVQLPWRPYQSVYRRKFLMGANLLFDEKLAVAEDCDFYLRCIKKVENYILTDLCYVKYRFFRKGSLINASNYAAVIGQLTVFAKAFESVECFNNQDLMKEYFANRYANIIILINALVDIEERENCFQFVEKHKKILTYTSKRLKYVIAKIFWKYAGFEKGSKCLIQLKKILKV